MIVSLKISNIALIEDIEIQFDKGLNILSGETGAGKSIILDSIALISGEHARTDLIRTGKEEAKILAIFYLDENSSVKEYLGSLGIDTKENVLIIERQIFKDKRPSLAFVNHSRVLVGALKTIGDMLLDIHSQHENQALLDPKEHLSLLDAYQKIKPLVHDYQRDFMKALEIKKTIQALEQEKIQKEEQNTFLEYQWNELESASLDFLEWEELEKTIESLDVGQQKLSVLQKIYAILYEQEDMAVINQLQEILFMMERRLSEEENLNEARESLKDILLKVEDVSEIIRDAKNTYDLSEEEIEQKRNRWDFLKELQNKYKKDIKALIEWQKELETLLSSTDRIADEIKEWEKERELLRTSLLQKALMISTERQKGAKNLKDAVQKELHDLHLLHTELSIDFAYVENEQGAVLLSDGRKVHLLKDGLERMQFLVSFNPGEEKKSLAKIGSGGEVGRFMLVLKKILGGLSPVTTQIFDEIDTGIGGETAFAVGKKILEIAKQRQVIAITHLPQIAAMGNMQYLVHKQTSEGRTHTHITLLSEEDRVAEISRMLSGDSLSSISLEHAKELLHYKNLSLAPKND